MRKRSKGWLVATALVALVVLWGEPGVARAQMVQPGAGEVTPFLGLAFGDDVDGGTLALGVAASYNVNLQISIEGEAGFLPDISGETDRVDTSVSTFSGNVLYHFYADGLDDEFVSYATAGLGFGRFSVDFEDNRGDRSSTELAVNVGGGIKARLSERVNIRADLRYFNINDENPDFWRVYGGFGIRLGGR